MQPLDAPAACVALTALRQLAAAYLTILLGCSRGSPQRERVMGTFALEDGSVLLSTERGPRADPRLTRVTSAGVAWRVPALGLVPRRNPVRNTAAIVEVHQFVWGGHSDGSIVIDQGLDLETGHVKWQHQTADLGAAVVGDGPYRAVNTDPDVHVYAPQPHDSPWEAEWSAGLNRELVRRDPRTGTVQRRVQLPAGSGGSEELFAIALGERVFVHQWRTLHVAEADGRTRIIARNPRAGSSGFPSRGGCAVGSDFVRFSMESGDHWSRVDMLVAPSGDLDHERRIPLELRQEALDGIEGLVDGCAEYRGRAVFEIDSDLGDPTDGRTRLVRVERDGHGLRELVLGASRYTTPLPRTDVRLWGSLSRFLPVVLEAPRSEGLEAELVVIDLEQMRVAWSHAVPKQRTGHLHTLFQHDGRWYLATGDPFVITWVVIDGRTGGVLGAQRVVCDGCGFTTSFGAHNVGGDAIWLAGQGWYPEGKIPLVRLDATTLFPRFIVGPIRVEPAHDWR